MGEVRLNGLALANVARDRDVSVDKIIELFCKIGSRETTFRLCNHDIPFLRDRDQHRFLGKPIGYNLCKDFSCVNDAISIGMKLLTSKLAPWQRLDALRTFFYPALQFYMRTGQFGKEDWKRIDSALRREIKKTLNLPVEASNNYLYGSREAGCCGLPILAEDSDLYLADTALKLLSSRDPIVRDIALQHLKETSGGRLQRDVSEVDVANFLSGSMEDEFQTSTNNISNCWTRARIASRRSGISWSFHQWKPLILFEGEAVRPTTRKSLLKVLRSKLRDKRTAALISLRNQGKAMECVAASPSSSHFLYSGDYTQFCDWRFIHRARLNLVRLNGAKTWSSDANALCRKCGRDRETLPHVLNHCWSFSNLMQQRHNAVLDRIVRAARYKCAVLSVNETVIPGNPLPPDAVIKRGDSIFILDVTIAFENRKAAFEAARTRKIEKYQGSSITSKLPIVMLPSYPSSLARLGLGTLLTMPSSGE
ncbi:uncharacterized protein T26G10.4-like [Uloborus diversus]|uniref:uncharacterized protein T26G10.4-like n=1 Tax=Uloborus diversus TaxID=327109 RepID=UPI002409DCE7|nr:uncharacterized protein T26G10.4-like [Uloborus diversus]